MLCLPPPLGPLLSQRLVFGAGGSAPVDRGVLQYVIDQLFGVEDVDEYVGVVVDAVTRGARDVGVHRAAAAPAPPAVAQLLALVTLGKAGL
jgi:hypothetical protein